jgi:hypothetical protein
MMAGAISARPLHAANPGAWSDTRVMLFKGAILAGPVLGVAIELVHMARLSPPDRRTTLILLTPDGDGVWYGPGAPLGLRWTNGIRG